MCSLQTGRQLLLRLVMARARRGMEVGVERVQVQPRGGELGRREVVEVGIN